MKKLISLIIIMSMSILLLVGCGTKSSEDTKDTTTSSDNKDTTTSSDNKDTTAPTDSTTPTEPASAITINHSLGSVTLTGEVKKAVVFDFGILDIINTLGIEVDLAVPTASLPAYLDKYADVTNAGNIKEPDLETIFDFEPDVIFIGGRQASYYDQLSEIAPTIYVQLNGDTYMEDVTNNIGYVAEVFDKKTEADAKLAEINSRIEETKALTTQSEAKALVLLTNDGALSVYGIGSRFGIIHDVLAVKTADESIETSTHGQTVNYEYISKINPDLLFVIDRTSVVGGTNTAIAVLDNDLVNGTKAAQNDNIISLNPDTWYLSGGGIQSVLEMIAEVEQAFK